MRPGFMSSVVPKQTVSELIATAKKYGYEGIEFRVEWNHKHGIELTSTDAQVAQARKMLEDNGIAASCVATTVKFNQPELGPQLKQREDLRRYIELAAKLGAPYIRTFGDTLPAENPALCDEILSLAAQSYASVDDWAKQHGIVVLIETHTNMSGKWAKQIMDEAQADNLGVLWHIGHHLKLGTSVAETYPYIRGHVRHVHFSPQETEFTKDSDNQETFDLLSADGFQGFFSLEKIDPEDPEAVLEFAMAKYKQFMANIR